MKIKSLQLKNFKRFTDLTLQGIPDNAKLVLLIGSNGSGKSSVFDAFQLISETIHAQIEKNLRPIGPFLQGKEYSYYHKWPNELSANLSFADNTIMHLQIDSYLGSGFESSSELRPNMFYGRSAVRYLPRVTRTSIGQSIDVLKDSDRPAYFIDEDNRFENDIDLLIKDVVENIFKGINSDNNQKLLEVRFFLDKINEAFPRVFGANNGTKLIFRSFAPPAEGRPSRLIFKKGNSELDYDLLSAGEKEVVNLLFNLFVRNKVYNDSIYFMDEVDSHLNTSLQSSLLKEIIENWIPENCQLWTASHSLGFIKYAKENENAVIFDLDDFDFDQSKTLVPEPKENPRLYNIAVDEDILPDLFRHFRIVFVENKDKQYYGSVGIKETVFVPENGRNGVYHKVKSGEYQGIVDRDFLTDDDITAIEHQYKNLKILRYYSVENYLFHPDNLEEYYLNKGRHFDKKIYVEKLIEEKNSAKQSLMIKLLATRFEYPYFKEPDFNGKSDQKRFKKEQENETQCSILVDYLNSDVLEEFYKVFPMKSNATNLAERQSINKSDLAKTKWFGQQIEKILSN